MRMFESEVQIHNEGIILDVIKLSKETFTVFKLTTHCNIEFIGKIAFHNGSFELAMLWNKACSNKP